MSDGGSDSYIRYWGLVVEAAKGGGQVLELSSPRSSGNNLYTPPEGLRIVFYVRKIESPTTPSISEITVYNATREHAKAMLQGEFNKVILQAGYSGPDGQGRNYGVIFQGKIKQVKRGRENATDTYIKIYAADDDGLARVFSNIALPEKWKYDDAHKQVVEAFKKEGIEEGQISSSEQGSPGGVAHVRPQVSTQMTAYQLEFLRRNAGWQYYIEDGKLHRRPVDAMQQGEAIKLNSRSGMIGMPENTTDGVVATALINPRLKLGGRFQINQGDLNLTTIFDRQYPGPGDLQYIADTTADGYYGIIAVEHQGDSRGTPWYTAVTGLATDSSGKIISSPGSGAPNLSESPENRAARVQADRGAQEHSF
jgi:hypothetical protein